MSRALHRVDFNFEGGKFRLTWATIAGTRRRGRGPYSGIAPGEFAIERVESLGAILRTVVTGAHDEEGLHDEGWGKGAQGLDFERFLQAADVAFEGVTRGR